MQPVEQMALEMALRQMKLESAATVQFVSCSQTMQHVPARKTDHNKNEGDGDDED